MNEVNRRRPKLVVLDINMPNVDGIEALRRLRAKPEFKDLPVIMFSTARNDDEVETCLILGISGFVQKPTNYSEFAKAVLGIVELAA